MKLKVGDPEEDHHCWVRPENMKTTRTVLKIDKDSPGTEIAAETAAAMASSSMVFRSLNKTYARRLLNKAKTVYNTYIYDYVKLINIQFNNNFLVLVVAAAFFISKSAQREL